MTPLDLYAAHVHGGVSMRALAKQLGTHTSTVLRRIRRVEQARDNPLIDLAADNPPVAADQVAGEALAVQFSNLPGVDLVVDGTADRAMVVKAGTLLWSGSRGPILALAVARKLVPPQRLGGLLKAQFKGAPKPPPCRHWSHPSPPPPRPRRPSRRSPARWAPLVFGLSIDRKAPAPVT